MQEEENEEGFCRYMNKEWIVSARIYALILCILGIVGYVSNPEKAISSLVMASGVGLVLYLTSFGIHTILAPLKALTLYLIVILLYTVAIFSRAYIAWCAWYNGNEDKFFVLSLLSCIGIVSAIEAAILIRVKNHMYTASWTTEPICCKARGFCSTSSSMQDEEKMTATQAEEKVAVVRTESAYFAAGCFWSVEAQFQTLRGIISTRVGYAGGWKENPTYEEVCSDSTGHIETVEVIFDPKGILYDDLLSFFWKMHDPTTVDQQGHDIGSQYKSAILYTSEEQRKKAYCRKTALQKTDEFKNKTIVTQIVPMNAFWKAEEYHQNYVRKSNKHVCV